MKIRLFPTILVSSLFILCIFYLTKSPVDIAEVEKPKLDKLAQKSIPSDHLSIRRSYPDDSFDVEVYTKAMRAAHREHQLHRSADAGFDAEWTVQGPGNIGARINSTAVHPTNENIIYSGFSDGGVWKTTNGGADWLPIFDDQTFLRIGNISLDPNDPETVYVGTGDFNVPGSAYIGDGLYKSTDGGATWTHLGLEAQRIISKVIVDPSNSQTVYAATMGLPYERNNDRGLYKSTNGGEDWEQILFISDSTGISDLLIDPSNSKQYGILDYW